MPRIPMKPKEQQQALIRAARRLKEEANAGLWALQVNEARVFASQGAEWWVVYRQANNARCRDVRITIGGNLVEVDCGGREHGEELRNVFIQNGIPASALAVRRRSGADG